MFSLTKFKSGFRDGRLAILYQCKRYKNLEQSLEELRMAFGGKNRKPNAYKTITEDEPDVHSHPDPLEYRNIGPYKIKGIHPKYKRSLINENSVFYDVKSVTLTGTLKNVIAKMKLKDQSYNPERVLHLGPDLAAAHFVVCRGGGIKFVGENKFIRGEVNRSYEVLPNEKDPNYKVEAIDLSSGNFVYEAMSNLADLKYLSWISFRNCAHVDNWYLDHFSSIAPTIEYLDISGCNKIDHFALGCFYRFKKLRCVNVEGTNDSDAFKLACLTYEAEYPNLVFVGLKLKSTPKSIFND